MINKLNWMWPLISHRKVKIGSTGLLNWIILENIEAELQTLG